MKKFLMTIVAACAAVSMNAQVYLGGGIGFKSVSHDGDSKSEFAIMPEVGYTLDENSAIGITLGYASYANDDSKLSVAPYYRYNLAKFGNVSLFADGTVYFSQYTKKDGNVVENKDLKTNTFGLGIKPGVAVSLTKELSFVSHLGFLGYENAKEDVSGAKATSTFGLDFSSLNLTFGLYYNF